jgi:hypothetical protein
MLTAQMMRTLLHPRQYALVRPPRGPGRVGAGAGGSQRGLPSRAGLALRRPALKDSPGPLHPPRSLLTHDRPHAACVPPPPLRQAWIRTWPYPLHQVAICKVMRAMMDSNDPAAIAPSLD